MPVVPLTEYLGLSEPPENPVFDRTRSLTGQIPFGGTPWSRTANVVNAIGSLRQQRPLAQIQAIQNQYDTIRSQAENIRREQEVAKQAEEAVSALAGLTPEKDDYLQQRRQIQTQFPSAMLDPRVQRIIDDSDSLYNNRAKAMAQAQQAQKEVADKLNNYRIQATELGIPWESIKSAPEQEIASLISQKKGPTQKDPALQAISDHYERITEAMNDMAKRADVTGVDVTQIPEYLALDKERQEIQPRLIDASRRNWQSRIKQAAALVPNSPLRPPERISGLISSAAPTIKTAAEAPIVTAANEPSIDQQLLGVPLSQREEFIAQKQKESEQNAAIAKAWNDARDSIDAKIRKVIPDKIYPGTSTNQLDDFARRILAGETNPTLRPASEEGGYGSSIINTLISPTPIWVPVLEKAGVGRNLEGEKAFAEPGEKRLSAFGLLGSQNVPYEQLMEKWARDHLASRNKLVPVSQSPTGIPLTERQKTDLEELMKTAGEKVK